MRARTLLAAALLPLLIACDHRQIEGKTPSNVPPPTAAALPAKLLADATSGVADPALRDLLARHWSWTLAEDPVWATKYGDHRFDDRIADGTMEHHAIHVRQERAFLAEARAIHPANEADRTTVALLADQLDTDLAGEVCSFTTWSIGAYSDNPVTAWSTLADSHKVETPEDGASLVARYKQIGGAIDVTVTNLRAGAASGRIATAESIRRVVAMVDSLLAALAPTNIENEVDRYVYWPGQALGYKTGQLALLRLRKKAETTLGPRFSLRSFHDAVLHGGAVTLPVLDARIEAWMSSRKGTTSG